MSFVQSCWLPAQRKQSGGIVPGSVLARFEGSPAENELFRQGYFHVEGQASQLAALCVDPQPGETVIDCAPRPAARPSCLAEQMHSTGRLTAAMPPRTAWA